MQENTKTSTSHRILIIGAGAIGGFTAAMLRKNNYDVSLIDNDQAVVRAIQDNGLQIKEYPKPFHIPISSDPQNFGGTFEHIIVAVKSQFTADVMQSIEGKSAPDGLIYSFQNGLGNTDIMRDYLPKDQIVATVVSWAVINSGNGRLRVASNNGDFILGFEEKDSFGDERLLVMKKMLSSWQKTVISNNILGYRWTKLIVNSVIAPFGGLLGLSLGRMLKDKRINQLMTKLGVEGLQVADALHIPLEKVAGLNIRNFYYQPQPEEPQIKRWFKSMIPIIMRKIAVYKHGKIQSTFLIDLKHKKKTEVDFINGYIVKKGEAAGVETPLNRFMVQAIHEIENGKRTIGLENLPELEKAANL
ncbi:MAG: 2-dehydropantoate 2-reductase [Candidatus Heimdallarchaeota archaeon]|nr:2-dehydropantoate 2-reductase [Candidatus Heimdallarchaeota archaeon]